MSHYTLLALVPGYLAQSGQPADPDTGERTSLREYLEDLLEPFDEGARVEPYLKEVSWFYSRQRLADAGLLTIAEGDPGFIEAYVQAYNADPASWLADGKPLVATAGKAYEWSTYNPKSKWDWWVIGGRWSGSMPSAGDGPYVETGAGNSIHVRDLLANLDSPDFSLDEDGGAAGLVTFAVLTPAGMWHERGEMGWWAAVRDPKAAQDWLAEYRAVLEAHQDCLAVLLDLHI